MWRAATLHLTWRPCYGRCEVLTPRDVGLTWCPVVRHVEGKLQIRTPEGALERLVRPPDDPNPLAMWARRDLEPSSNDLMTTPDDT